MLNKQKYFPMGVTEANVINETDIDKFIKEGISVSARVIEYDILNNSFTIKISKNARGILFNDFCERKCTMASYVGRSISCTVTDRKNEQGYYICKADSHYYDAQDVLMQYEEGCKLQTIIAALTGYGVMLDAGGGACGLLHLNEIRKVYGENIVNPSQVFKIFDAVTAYLHHTDDGIKFSLQAPMSESNNKTVGILEFIKSKLAS